jgi:hypothetical protein
MNYRTRSGRHIKKPILFKPTEDTVVDDYAEHEYDTDDVKSDIDTEDEFDSESDYDSDEDDYEEDDNGNLKGFVVSDSEDEEDA